MTVERGESPQHIEIRFFDNTQGSGELWQRRVKTNKRDSKTRQGCYERLPVQTEVHTK